MSTHIFLFISARAKAIFLLAIILLAQGCGSSIPAYVTAPKYEVPEKLLAEGIVSAQGAQAASNSVRGIFSVAKGGEDWYSGEVEFSLQGNYIAFHFSDGSCITFRGDAVWDKPPVGPFLEMRADLLSWYSYLVLPFRMKDPGFELTLSGEKQLLGDKPYAKANLTFSSDAKNVPDDWYSVFLDVPSQRVHAIVAQVPGAQSEQKRMLVVYEQFSEIAGTLLPSVVRMYEWDDNAQRIIGERPIVTASLKKLNNR